MLPADCRRHVTFAFADIFIFMRLLRAMPLCDTLRRRHLRAPRLPLMFFALCRQRRVAMPLLRYYARCAPGAALICAAQPLFAADVGEMFDAATLLLMMFDVGDAAMRAFAMLLPYISLLRGAMLIFIATPYAVADTTHGDEPTDVATWLFHVISPPAVCPLRCYAFTLCRLRKSRGVYAPCVAARRHEGA